MICGLLKPLLLYFCDPSVDGVSLHPLVVLTLFGHFWHKESLLNSPIPLTLPVPGGGGGQSPGWPNSHLPIRNLLFYDAQTF